MREPGRHRGMRRALGIAALLTVAVSAAALVVGAFPADLLLDNSPLVEIKERYFASPSNQVLADELRLVDAGLREQWSIARLVEVTAYWALLAGILALVWLWQTDRTRAAPDAGGPTERADGAQRRRVGAWSGAALLLVSAAGVVGAGLLTLDVALEEQGGSPAASAPWPQFRGPLGSGVAGAGDWPRDWDLDRGTNVAWSRPLDLAGHGSPVVTARLVCLTGVKSDQRLVECFARENGDLVWQGKVDAPSAAQEDPFTSPDTGWAAPTPVVAANTLFAVYGTGHAGAFDLDGAPLWMTHLGLIETAYGFASSPVAHGVNVFLQLDQVPDRTSALYALNIRTGQLAWRVTRPVANSWATPVIVEQPRAQLITASNPYVISYEPSSGEELWRADVLGGDVAPSPVIAAGRVLVIEPRRKLVALRTDGTGDVTESAVVWTHEKGIPDIPTPLATDEVVVLISTTGLLHLLNPEDGSVLAQERVPGEFKASPLLVGDQVYLFDTAGRGRVFAWRDGWREVGGGTFGSAVTATPAPAEGTIYVRTAKRLVALTGGGQQP